MKRYPVYFLLIILSACGTAENPQQNVPSAEETTEIPKVAPAQPKQDRPIQNMVYKNYIKTVDINILDLELSLPVINLYGSDKLLLEFDDLEGGVKNYYYQIIHCNYNWTPSELSPFDYIDGFTEDVIDRYSFSSNTLQEYTHYNLLLPNERSRMTRSGNYIVKVYLNNNTEDAVLTQRFMVVEPQVEIPINISRPNHTEYRSTHQEVDFSIIHKGIDINNPFQDLKVVIMQNQRWDNAVFGLKPKFVKDKVLEYDYEIENLFPGGKEYRYFDIQSLRFQKERIKLVEIIQNNYHVYIAPDQPRSYEKYYYLRDINGKYFIDVSDYPNENTQADYAWVHFTLPFNAPLATGELFVFGELTNWDLDDRSRLEYNNERKAYETALYLKQGYYNYVYAWQQSADSQADLSFIEGNYFETENDYTILVYYRSFGTRFDKLIGIQTVNSLY